MLHMRSRDHLGHKSTPDKPVGGALTRRLDAAPSSIVGSEAQDIVHSATSAAMENTYNYSPLPLDPRSIRLLRRIPVASAQDHSYELAEFPLHNGPKYHALSYCWGSSSRSTAIQCNGTSLTITPILSEALQHVFELSLNGVEWLWVDQICINQADLQERGSQVDMMKEIYKISERTIIWLGSSTLR